jgi:L-asparaginase type I
MHLSTESSVAMPHGDVWWRRWILKLRSRPADGLVAAAPPPAGVAVKPPAKKEPVMTQVLRDRRSGQSGDPECSIGLVLTGGTIGAHETNSVLSVRDDAVAEASVVEDVWASSDSPQIIIESPLRKLSENLRPSDWVLIAESARRLIEEKDVDGVLILHGTDTMAYTAAALSFLLADVKRPIVLTGANLPSGQAESDASKNVHDSLVALRSLESGVYIAFAGGEKLSGQVYLGTRVRKLRASDGAFRSINRDVVGSVIQDRFEAGSLYAQQIHQRSIQTVDERVLALRIYPGINLDAMFIAITSSDVRGVVIELYASATGPDTGDQFSVPNFIRRCVEENIIVTTAVSQTAVNNGNTYETTVAIKQAGGLFLRDMLPETATVKLMWALAQSENPDVVRKLMLTPIAGELS